MLAPFLILTTILALITWAAWRLAKPVQYPRQQEPDPDACLSIWDWSDVVRDRSAREPMGRTPDGLRGEG